jgi:hypothetical protein
MSRLPAIILLFISLACYPQIPDGFPLIDKSDLPDAKFLPARHFTGESLFGYMDGGAELYREYGISDAVITEFDLQGGNYKCEIFKMNGPEEAFGIYSVSKFRCISSPPFSQFTCQSRYQLQICKGSYYISIINKSGSRADSLASLVIGKILSGKVKEPSADLVEFLPDSNHADIQRNAILVKGRLGLMNGATAWEDYFKGITGYCAVILPSGENTIISARFKLHEDFQQFMNLHGWSICDLSIYEIRIPGGELARIIGENHLLIRTNNQ